MVDLSTFGGCLFQRWFYSFYYYCLLCLLIIHYYNNFIVPFVLFAIILRLIPNVVIATSTGYKFVELSLVILEHLKGDFCILSHVIFCHLMSSDVKGGQSYDKSWAASINYQSINSDRLTHRRLLGKYVAIFCHHLVRGRGSTHSTTITDTLT